MIIQLLTLAKNYKTIGISAIALSVIVGSYTFGYSNAKTTKQVEIEKLQNEYNTYRATAEQLRLEVLAENETLRTKSAEKTVEVVTKYVDKIKKVYIKGKETVREVPIYITKESDAKCDIPLGFVRSHNEAANPTDTSTKTELPETTGASNDATTDIRLSEATETIAKNYGTCNLVAEQLKALQDWIRQQEQLYNK